MLESTVKVYKRETLRKPILIVGVPGIGLVANVAAKHILMSLNTRKLGEISSPFFQDVANVTIDGGIESPIMEMYYWKSDSLNDLIILYGNTQALTTYGQYELGGKILDIVQDLDCELVVGIGGLTKETATGKLNVYCTATDFGTLDRLLKHGLKQIQGQVFGMSGLLVGLAKLRGMKGFCLLAETTGAHPDVAVAKAVLDKLNSILGLKIELGDVGKSVDEVSNTFALQKDRA